MTRGGRNLVLLGVGSIAIAAITTGVSLALYQTSGDIYLDRSRPGYLPDEKENSSNQTKETYKFSDSGPLDKASLEEYLKNINVELDNLKKIDNPFDPTALSDDALGIKASQAPSDEVKDVDPNADQHIQHIED